MNIFILITGGLELLEGLALMIKPDAAPDFKGADSATLTWANMYGAAAIGIGTFAILTYLQMDPGTVRIFLQTFMVFHLLVAYVAFKGYRKGDFGNPAVAILHAVFALATAYFYLA